LMASGEACRRTTRSSCASPLFRCLDGRW
jgi:hypothetical protein